jgi:hypothetical protein
MASAAAAYRHEDIARAPRGWRVRSRSRGRHVVRIAFPPGPRRKGAGQVVEILHPKGEKKNPTCKISKTAKTNPGELLIFGNPAERANVSRRGQLGANGKGFGNHKPGCGCKFCQRAAKLQSGELKPPPLPNRKKNAAKRSTPRRRRKDRRNPVTRKRARNNGEQQAVQLYQSFHGKDPKEIVEKHVSAAIRLDYTALGDLEYVKVVTPLGEKAEFHFDSDHVKLASSPDGKQLYAIGGNQNLASCIDKDSLEKDFIDLGDGVEVSYLARKVHGAFRPVSYFHKFGEVDGTLPRIMFDKLKKQIFFIGGNYFIDTSKGVSPGIEN